MVIEDLSSVMVDGRLHARALIPLEDEWTTTRLPHRESFQPGIYSVIRCDVLAANAFHATRNSQI